MRDRVAVVGVGCTKFGERYDRGYEELICDAAFDAYDDAGIDPNNGLAARYCRKRRRLAARRIGCVMRLAPLL